MSSPAHPNRSLFVNIPVADLPRSKDFFARLGFTFDPAFTDEHAACMRVGEATSFMLLTRARFLDFSPLPVADTRTHAQALFCVGVSSREEVDSVSAAALAAGATEVDGLQDHGSMVSRSFFDLDGHGWEVLWMDPSAAGAAAADGAAAD